MQLSTSTRRFTRWDSDVRALAVDCVAICGLVLVGLLSHGRQPLADPLYAVESMAPFVIGWVGSTALVGLYTDRDRAALGEHLRSVVVCWLAAANVAFLIRGSPPYPGGTAWTFTVVMTGLGLLVVLGSRTGYERYVRKDENRS